MHYLFAVTALGCAMAAPCSFAEEPSASGTSSGAAAMERLSIKLPAEVAASEPIRGPLDELGRERCDQVAIANLGHALEKAGYRREAAAAHVNFSGSCGGHAASLRSAVNILFKLSDYAGAAEVATKLIKAEPFSDNGYFLRAISNDRAGLLNLAIDDYITAIELFGDKTRISSVSYYGLARVYEKLGQYCDAVLPIETWVAINPALHDNSQTRSIVLNYTSKGNCAAAASKGEETFPIARHNNVVTVPVSVNGTRGIFVVDTGATFVSLKSGFAKKANVETDQGSSLLLNTANGIGEGKRGRAKLVQFRSLQAKDVPVVVQADAKALFGDSVDGLLGMSFLSRFNVTIDTKSVKLSARTAK